jgi:hypothetical protein
MKVMPKLSAMTGPAKGKKKQPVNEQIAVARMWSAALGRR